MKQKQAPEENSPSQQTVDGPGSQLRKARERKGLEQSKMAAQLHLSQSMIQALEWDDYEKLPAAVFVQGYLRNYARLLEVDEDAVIQAYQELNPNAEQGPLPRSQPDDVAKELHSENRLTRLITWLVLLVLGVLIFFWWQGQMESTETPPTVEPPNEEIETTFTPLQQEDMALPQGELLAPPPQEPERLPPFPADDLPAAAVEETPAAEQPQATGTGALTQPEPFIEQAPDNEVARPVVPELAASVPETAFDPLPETEAEPVAPTGAEGVVVFEFTGPCWVEVRDATGRARIIGVMRDGVRRSLAAGLGPFRVVIGDIQAARLSVNGEEYDLQRHTRGKVARFTLDPSRL